LYVPYKVKLIAKTIVKTSFYLMISFHKCQALTKKRTSQTF
jgi:hypothetical protein